MNEKQKLFALEYIKDLNATRAYKEIYKSCKKDETAMANGSRLLGNDKVKKFIDEKLKEMESNKIASAQEVLEYLTSVMRGEAVGHEIVVESVGDYTTEAREIEKSPSEKEKLKAAELLGKRYGVFTEKIKVEDPEGDRTKQSISNIENLVKQMIPISEDDVNE